MKRGFDPRELTDHVAGIRQRSGPITRSTDVSERRQLFLFLGIDVLKRLDAGGKGFQLSAHRGSSPAIAGNAIVLLARITREVIQLGARSIDVLIPAADERTQLAPAEVDARIVGFGVERLRRLAFGDAEDVEDRRSDVSEREWLPDSLAVPRRMRQLNHQRDLQRLAIQQDSVLVLAMIVQTFAVIGEKDDQRAIVDAERLEMLKKIADDASDFAISPS